MDTKTFLGYFLKALHKALENDNTNYGYLVKDHDWYYPEDELLYEELTKFEDDNYDSFPIFDMVELYFDSKSHGFPDVGETDIETCREQIIKEMDSLAKEYNISYQ